MQRIKKDNLFRNSCFISFAILLIIVFMLPDGFHEFRNTDTLAPFWYMITLTGGVYGASLIIVLLSVYLFHNNRKKPSARKNTLIFISIVVIFQTLISASTLFIFKDYFREPRPSQLYFIEKGVIENGGREFFAMPLEEKNNYLRKRIDENKNNFHMFQTQLTF